MHFIQKAKWGSFSISTYLQLCSTHNVNRIQMIFMVGQGYETKKKLFIGSTMEKVLELSDQLICQDWWKINFHSIWGLIHLNYEISLKKQGMPQDDHRKLFFILNLNHSKNDVKKVLRKFGYMPKVGRDQRVLIAWPIVLKAREKGNLFSHTIYQPMRTLLQHHPS